MKENKEQESARMIQKSRETGTKKENQCKREQKRKNFKT